MKGVATHKHRAECPLMVNWRIFHPDDGMRLAICSNNADRAIALCNEPWVARLLEKFCSIGKILLPTGSFPNFLCSHHYRALSVLSLKKNIVL